MRSNLLASMAAMAMLAGPGMVAVGGPQAIEALPEIKPRRRQVQTQTTPPAEWENEHVNTRQVRRQRERLSRKFLPGSSTRTRTDMPRSLHPNFGRSKYMPHIGKKERGRYLPAA